jgi:uncharacterized damage-inducible protein DinB
MNEGEALRTQLMGENSHVGFRATLDGLSPRTAGARVSEGTHTILEVLEHMIYWQEIVLARLRHEAPESPRSAVLGWTSRSTPPSLAEWETAVGTFAGLLRDLEALMLQPAFELAAIADEKRGTRAREELLMIQGHNSYHLGQIVLLRQLLGAWPPPGGGNTW